MALDHLKPDTWLSTLRHPTIYNLADNADEGSDIPVEFYKKIAKIMPKIGKNLIKNQEKMVRIEQERGTSREQPIELSLAHEYGMTKEVVEEKIEDFQTVLYSLSTTEDLSEQEFDTLCMKAPTGQQVTREIIRSSKEVVERLLNELELTWRCIDEGIAWLKEEHNETFDELCKIQSMYEYLNACIGLGTVLSHCIQLIYSYYKYVTEPEHIHCPLAKEVEVGITTKEASRTILYHVNRIRP